MLQLRIQRHIALFGLGQCQQLRTHIDQKLQPALRLGKALQQPRARRDQRTAQRHFGLAALFIAGGLVIALACGLQGFGIGAKLLDGQQPEILVHGRLGLGIPLHQRLGMAAALHIAERCIGHLLHFLQQTTQLTRRKRFLPAPERGIQPLRQRALLLIGLATFRAPHPELGLLNPVCCPTHVRLLFASSLMLSFTKLIPQMQSCFELIMSRFLT